ncbi:MAG: phytanoyl-CoA dioxygenase family protein [Pirellula sp.]|nr:phytanoyl-CoA dioxygenase family protein [Pirellula sp.]
MSRCESDLGNIHQQLQTLDHSAARIEEQGFCVLDRTLTPAECELWCSYVDDGLSRAEIGPLRTGREQATQTYGSRNVLSLLPRIVELVKTPLVFELCKAVLGEKLGVVRALYFDKPPGASWALPWHQDLTIAIKQHYDAIAPTNSEWNDWFSKPTTKAGVCHVEAPRELLESMLTIRVHLDAMGPENGPLHVRPGSHRFGKLREEADANAANDSTPIYCNQGSVMLMRPLLSHSSIGCLPNCMQHRRIIHLELCNLEPLPTPFEWHTWITVQN